MYLQHLAESNNQVDGVGGSGRVSSAGTRVVVAPAATAVALPLLTCHAAEATHWLLKATASHWSILAASV